MDVNFKNKSSVYLIHCMLLQHTKHIGIMITTDHMHWVRVLKTHFIHHTWTLYKSCVCQQNHISKVRPETESL